MKLYVQYGCGWSAPRTWRNFDASPTLRFEKIPGLGRLYTKNARRFPSNVEYGDIVKGLPLKPNSCDAIFACHVLEHLALNDFRVALLHTHKLLKHGGVFRMIVPDLRVLAEEYVNSSDPLAAHDFIRKTSLGVETRRRGVVGLITAWLGNSSHLWMWDYNSLQYELTNAGFVSIRQCTCGDSSDPLFVDVEESERFGNAVAVECYRPMVNREIDLKG
jgi:predicted SAM-dependent methyltransferase